MGGGEHLNIRHLNRGDVREGGCSLCKPRYARSSFHPDEYMAMADIVDGLDEFADEFELDEDDLRGWE